MTDWRGIVGDGWARPGAAADAVDGVVPVAVVRPGCVAEVQAVVREARALVATGLGGHLDVGAPPGALDVLLGLDRLAAVTDHQAGDMTVTVEAGCPLPTLARTLAAHGQWLPLDPPRPEATTIGGLLAANLSGPLRASQGTARDHLIGIRTVAGDGSIVAGGGKVVKNVAGYDLPKLHVGALGTLAVIVEATFKVRPVPGCEEALVVACRSAGEAADVALALRDVVEPFWLEVAGRDGIAEGPGAGAAIAVGLGGMHEEVAAARARLEATAAARGCRTVMVAAGATLRMRLGTFDVEPAAAVVRVGVLPGEVGLVIEEVEHRARDARCLAHAASGVVRIAVASAESVRPLVEALRGRFGTVVVARATPEVKRGLDLFGDAGPARDLMRGVKHALDPQDRLAPGRFLV